MFTRNTMSMLLLPILVAFFCINKVQAQSKAMGEPVPGAEIYIELEPDDEPIANITTDQNGEFEIVFSNGGNNLPNINNLPSIGTFVFTIKPPKSFAIKYNIVDKKFQKAKVKFDKNKDGKVLKNGNIVLRYVLTWLVDQKAQNKGSFAVSGKSST
ncbi:MAG: hypothetical protein N2321_12640 [Melioribacteraceae bacterium]|nr:hypothetical protein [Melioribacteraceae bacterium]